jgi:quercetin dioxygenase-like cupin family protein
MNPTRREVASLFPALVAAGGVASAAGSELPSKCYRFEELPEKTNAKTHNQTRAVFDGISHGGAPLELHVTTLEPGQMPHPEHQHVHDEMILVQEGTLEVTIAGQGTKIGPGSIAYVHSNERHGWKNIGDGRAQYFVVAIGQKA